MTTPEFRLRATDDVDLIAIVPYLLGFHPADSLVTIGVDEGRVQLTTRVDLPPTTEDASTEPFLHTAERTAAQIAATSFEAIVIGYGSADRIAAAARPLAAALTAAGVALRRMIRVDDHRYYCVTPGCIKCPPEGTPYSVAKSQLPAQATYAGMVVLPSRDSLDELIAPVTGPEQERMHVASLTALRHLATRLPAEDRNAVSAVPAELLTEGKHAVDDALHAAADGQPLSDEAAAMLHAFLLIPPVRDYAAAACDGSSAQRALWTDLTRRAEPDLAAAPASLLALTAYLGGNGALARVALQRALTAEPDYRIAHLLDDVLSTGIHPNELRRFTNTRNDNR
ncbi:DUF4192 domain-containing protein [Cryptosporangium arvum]|uniref:DUF4192 domain-containing protein n=1 Tax=Cryptosporangium arvum DSM 44712 TaxID=927661 RepID=A0A010ZXN2_9ACTN|nr:DUF4192 domain-containing protein [Cryptosporangium arvum]EXG81982.1 hypothetical protein CryarDRAFT_3109 [Cryptosporangium arvum DSM 44712]